MPLTKNDLQLIKDTLKDTMGLDTLKVSIDKLTETNENLKSTAINEINTKVSRLETQLSKDVSDIRSELATLTVSNITWTQLVERNKNSTDESINDLGKKVIALEAVPLVDSEAFETVVADLEKLKNRFSRLEKDTYRGLQHDRLWNIEIEGIPMNIGEDSGQLEVAALAIFEAINVECFSENIEAIHRLPAKDGIKPTILCIDNRKIVRALHRNKHKLKDLNTLNLNLSGLTDESKIFINPSLTPYSKRLAFNCRVLRRAGHVSKIRIEDDGLIKIIKDGEEDLTTKFPNFGDFSFD